MHIVNMYSKEIPACASFAFRGHIISMSTIFQNSSIAVFKNATGLAVHEAHSVEAAINWIIKQTEKQS
jgi:hypothetical protein